MINVAKLIDNICKCQYKTRLILATKVLKIKRIIVIFQSIIKEKRSIMDLVSAVKSFIYIYYKVVRDASVDHVC